jgi:hypothetical protein
MSDNDENREIVPDFETIKIVNPKYQNLHKSMPGQVGTVSIFLQ